MRKSILQGKERVTIFGMGRSGISATKLLSFLKKEISAVNSGDPKNWHGDVADWISLDRCYNQDDAERVFIESDLIIIAPGIPQTHPVLKEARESGVTICTEIELAYGLSEVPIVAITGTNGKTTTVSLLEDIFKRSDYNVFIGGNIGIPFCEMIYRQLNSSEKFDLVVLELSSFQLETTIHFHPIIAAILNMTPSHGERYDDYDDYFRAKLRIAEKMNRDDLFITFKDCWDENKLGSIDCCKLVKIEGAEVIDHLSSIYDLSKRKIIGDHNLKNIAVVDKIMNGLQERKIIDSAKELTQQGIDNFPGVAHRIEYVANDSGLVEIYNDAKSTNIISTTIAIEAFNDCNQDLYLIYGGQRRSEDDSIKPYLQHFASKLTKVFLIGDTTDSFASEIDSSHSKLKYFKAHTIERVKEIIIEHKLSGKILFSPGFPSFDQFKNYIDRGESFKALMQRF